MRARISLFLLTILFGTAGAGEMVLREDFKKLDLNKIPLLYSTYTEDLSIVDDNAQGKVLKISHAGGDRPALSIQLENEKVVGHLLRVSVAAKLPTAYAPVPDKTNAQAYVQLIIKDKDGKDLASAKALSIDAGKPDWQKLSFTTNVEKEAAYVAISVGLNWIKADVFFDDLTVEVDPDEKVTSPTPGPPTPPLVKEAKPVKETKPPGPPDPAKILAELADKAPNTKIDMGGINFGPEIAAAMQKMVPKAPSAAKNTVFFAGPGLPVNDLDKKLPAGWSAKQAKELSGSAAAPRNLFMSLPDFLAKQKPEIVILFGESAVSRKLEATERLDWEDLARLCVHMGALPVLAIPPAAGNEQKDELRNAMLKAGENLHCAVIEVKTGLMAGRIGELTDLLQRHVLGRVPVETPEAQKPAVKNNED